MVVSKKLGEGGKEVASSRVGVYSYHQKDSSFNSQDLISNSSF